MEAEGALYVLIGMCVAFCIAVLAFHIHHGAVQLMARLKRVMHMLKRDKHLPPKDVNSNMKTSLCAACSLLLIGIALELLILYLFGAYDAFVKLVVEYAVLGTLVIGLAIAVIAIIVLKGYLMLKFFHRIFDGIEHKLMEIVEDVEGVVEDVEEDIGHCKAKPC